ncbi:hypothetical protein ACGFW5_22740 [Streptomyces sp. NPDC048416]|uniref:hypothetical protein n=1 Tax=Streptomyces sp. NPDC048416 TaxID=3365546 RepID=UPI003712567E
MVRNVIGSILALVGAAAAVWSPFRAWYDGRHGSAYRIDDLFSGISPDKAAVAGSLLLPFAFAALVTLVALVLRSRALVVVAAVVVLGFTVLWMVRQGQAAGSLTVDSSGKGMGQGVALALGGGLVMLLGAALMAGRRVEPSRTRSRVPAVDAPYERGAGGPGEGRAERGAGAGHGGPGREAGYAPGGDAGYDESQGHESRYESGREPRYEGEDGGGEGGYDARRTGSAERPYESPYEPPPERPHGHPHGHPDAPPQEPPGAPPRR